MLINWVKILDSPNKNKKVLRFFKIIIIITAQKSSSNQSYRNKIMELAKKVRQEITQIHTQRVKERMWGKVIDQYQEKRVFLYVQNK